MTGASVSRRPLFAKLPTGRLELDVRAVSIILPRLGKRHNGRVGNVLRPTSFHPRCYVCYRLLESCPSSFRSSLSTWNAIDGSPRFSRTRWIHFSSVVLAELPVFGCVFILRPTHTTEQRHKRHCVYEKFTIPAQRIIEKTVAPTPNAMSETTLNQKIVGCESRRRRVGTAPSSGLPSGRISPAVRADNPDRIIRTPHHAPKPTRKILYRTGMATIRETCSRFY